MWSIRGSYTLFGACLILAGAILSYVSHIILRSTPITALGLSTMLLGAVSLAVGRGQPKIPPNASAILLESSLENLSAIIEELGLRSKAVYLPSSMTSGKPKALIPLHLNPNPPNLKVPLPKRLIVKYGPNPEDMGLLITTPGSAITEMLRSKPSPTLGDLESALSSVLAGLTGLADAVKATVSNQKITVEVSNPHLEHKSMWVNDCLGSPMASIVASTAAEVLDKPVIINREEPRKGKSIIELTILR
jgi:hypothetical protein